MKCPKCRGGYLGTEDGLTYCKNCAYEPPESQVRPAVPPAAGARAAAPPVIEVQSSAALGRGCIERAEVIAAEIVKLQKAIKERQAEGQKLVKVAEFCEVAVPSGLANVLDMAATRPRAAAARQPRADGAPRNSWKCPDCGHETVSRWVQRHRDECAGKAAAS